MILDLESWRTVNWTLHPRDKYIKPQTLREMLYKGVKHNKTPVPKKEVVLILAFKGKQKDLGSQRRL